jgi:hypothetical protein
LYAVSHSLPVPLVPRAAASLHLESPFQVEKVYGLLIDKKTSHEGRRW